MAMWLEWKPARSSCADLQSLSDSTLAMTIMLDGVRRHLQIIPRQRGQAAANDLDAAPASNYSFPMPIENPTIARFKTAIRRYDLSLPMKCAIADGLLGSAASVFDYGCGHGEDIEHLAASGIACDGWDPAFRPNQPLREADVVNLGYVINVIEDPAERLETLRRAWGLCQRLLVVAALVKIPGRGNAFTDFGDGVLTKRGTFQKFFDQSELKQYLEAELGAEAIPATVGVFYVFKEDALRQEFLANRYRRRSAAPRQRVSERRFEEHRDILQPFMECLALVGRIPDASEFPRNAEIIARFGSLKRAFALVRRVTGEESWALIRRRRSEDLLVFLALARFRKRPKFSGYPSVLRRDIRSFFGTFTKACQQADELLFRVGQADAIDEACKRSAVGKLLPNALYVHRSALDGLEPLLRIYEGCGRAYLGDIEGSNIIKLHRFSGKLSYLAYPAFDTEPHPILARSVKLSLRTRQLDCYDYSTSDNPPVLHRKETFLQPEHALYEKFAKLTMEEEEHGLLDDSATIGTRDGWQERLRKSGFTFHNDELVRVSPAKPQNGS
jgi:DNA phosphorothioation-associated putative methyltransferase